MGSVSFLPVFFKQCCDADTFLKIGKQCALHNHCYTDLRPGGIGYWFSWPVRLGLPDSTLICANIILLLVSSWLAVLVIRKLLPRPRVAKSPIIVNSFIAIASFCIHLVFFWPTLFTSLSDPPSGLIILNGIWLLLLSQNKNSLLNFILIAAGSTMVGFGAWMRAFYFYPLLVGMAIGCTGFCFLRQHQKKACHILILCALIFPGIQILHTYKTSKKIAYMNTVLSNEWSDKHLVSKEIGYDTVLPPTPMYSLPQYCNINNGLLPSLKEHDYQSVMCLFFNRMIFYLSTYKQVAYIDNIPPKNRLFGADTSMSVHGLDMDVVKDSSGTATAVKLTKNQTTPEDDVYVALHVALPSDTEYTFSVELWSDQPGDMEIAFSRHNDRSLIAKKLLSVTTQPQRFFVSGKTLGAKDYNISIGNMPFANGSTPLPPVPSPFYVWNLQLETGTFMTEYSDSNDPNPEILRPKYPLLLAANITAILAALLFLVGIRQRLFPSPTHLVAVSLIIFSFAQALVIIPEQRFAAVPMTFIWLMAIAWLLSFLGRKTTST